MIASLRWMLLSIAIVVLAMVMKPEYFPILSEWNLQRENLKLFKDMESQHSECTHYFLQQDLLPQPGQHLVCVKGVPSDTELGGSASEGVDNLIVSIIPDSLRGREHVHKINGVRESKTDEKWKELDNFFEVLYDRMGAHERPIHRWRVYTPNGRELLSLDEVVEAKSVVIYTGASFIWPGVSIGHRQRTPEGFVLETLSLRPLVFKVENFLSHEECDYIRSESEGFMEASGTLRMDADVDKPDSTWRTSTQTFLDDFQRPILASINERTSTLTRTHVDSQEDVQVLRYTAGQFYDQHYDYFDPQFYQNNEDMLMQLVNGTNRLVTVFWYLSSISDGNGGHTIFPLVNGAQLGNFHDFKNCDVSGALKVQPRKGEVIIFYSLTANQELDRGSLHGACPHHGKDEEKWAANKWIWTQPDSFRRRKADDGKFISTTSFPSSGI